MPEKDCEVINFVTDLSALFWHAQLLEMFQQQLNAQMFSREIEYEKSSFSIAAIFGLEFVFYEVVEAFSS